MVVLGGGAVFYERGTPVGGHWNLFSRKALLPFGSHQATRCIVDSVRVYDF